MYRNIIKLQIYFFKLQFIHKLTASDTSKTAKKSQKGDTTEQAMWVLISPF